MKVIWDAQSKQQLYAIDEAALHKRVSHKSRQFNRRVFWRDVREIGVGVLSALFLTEEGLVVALTGEGFFFASRYSAPPATAGYLFVAAACFLFSAVFMYAGRKRQQKLEQRFDSTLQGDLEKDLSQTSYQIRLLTGVVWWSLLPSFVGTALALYVVSLLNSDTRIEMFLMILLVIPAAFFWVRRCNLKVIENKLLPRQRDLESLRAKLADPETSAARG